MIGTQIQQIEANQAQIHRLEQLRVNRFAALIKSIAWQIAKNRGYDSTTDRQALQEAQKIAAQRT